MALCRMLFFSLKEVVGILALWFRYFVLRHFVACFKYMFFPTPAFSHQPFNDQFCLSNDVFCCSVVRVIGDHGMFPQ